MAEIDCENGTVDDVNANDGRVNRITLRAKFCSVLVSAILEQSEIIKR